MLKPCGLYSRLSAISTRPSHSVSSSDSSVVSSEKEAVWRRVAIMMCPTL